MKALHREIMLSATYRLSADQSAKNMGIDPENRLLWRANIQRLDAEALRDSLLSVSGELNLEAGGPPQKLNDGEQPETDCLRFREPQQAGWHAFVVRFSEPEYHQRETERHRESVAGAVFPQQQSSSCSGRKPWPSACRRIRSAMTRRGSRAPTGFCSAGARAREELQLGLTYVKGGQDGSWPRYMQALLNSNEFLFVN